MNRRLRQVRSEIPAGRFIRRNIKRERTKTPMRFSRRIRHLPPEDSEFFINTFNIKKEKLGGKHVISQESSIQFNQSQRGTRQRKLRYPQRARHSKEVISILSAPRICNRKAISEKKMLEIPVRVKGSSYRANLLVKDQNAHCCHYTTSSFRIPTKKEPTAPGAEKILQKRKKYVLEVLNKGEIRDIERLPSVGSKTAERIVLFRQLKGSINKISELAKMPKFPKRRFNNFVAQNFLKVD